VQVGTNSNPASDDTCCDQLFWAAHDANYNVRALVEIEIQGSQTHLAERYEYTPYGESPTRHSALATVRRRSSRLRGRTTR